MLRPDLTRISEIQSIGTKSTIEVEVQQIQLDVGLKRNTFLIKVDATETNEIIQITTSQSFGGYFEIVLSGSQKVCVEYDISANSMENHLLALLKLGSQSLANVDVSREGPTSNGYSWYVTFTKTWDRQDLSVSRFCNDTSSQQLVGASSNVYATVTSPKNIVSGAFVVLYSHQAGIAKNSSIISLDATEDEIARKIEEIDDHLGSVRVMKRNFRYSRGIKLDVCLQSISNPAVSLTVEDRTLSGNGKSIKVEKITNSSTINAKQRVIFRWLTSAGDYKSSFKISFRGATSARVNVSNTADEVKLALEAMSSIDVVSVEKFGDCLNQYNNEKQCFWDIYFETNGGRVESLSLPSVEKQFDVIGTTVQVQILEHGTDFLSGGFQIEYGGASSSLVPYDADADTFEGALAYMSNIGLNAIVSRSDRNIHKTVTWNVTFRGSYLGNISLVTVNVSALRGPDVTINTQSILNQNTIDALPILDGSLMSGSFRVSFLGQDTLIPFNSSSTEVHARLSNLAGTNNISVTREGPIDIDLSYIWHVTFNENIGVQPLFVVTDDSLLKGLDAFVFVNKTRPGNDNQKDEFTVTLTNFTTRPLQPNCSAEELRAALIELPSIGHDLDVSRSGPTSAGAYIWTITFISNHNYGDVSTLQVTSTMKIDTVEVRKGAVFRNLFRVSWDNATNATKIMNAEPVVGSPSNGIIRSMLAFDNRLYIAGQLSYVDSLDGVHGRHNFASGLNGIAVYNANIQQFLQLNGASVMKATADGSIEEGKVFVLRKETTSGADDVSLLVGGDFNQVNGKSVKNIMKFTVGSKTISSYGNGIGGKVLDISTDYLGRIVAVGSFSTAGCLNAPYFALWEGSRRWMGIQPSPNADVRVASLVPSPVAYALLPANGTTAGGTEIVVFGSFLRWKFKGEPSHGDDVSQTFKVEIGKYNSYRICKNVRWEVVGEQRGIRCLTPGGYGTANKVLITSQGVKDITSQATADFTYNTPVITGITPSTISAAGGEIVNITGSNFGSFSPQIGVYIGGVPCTSSIWISNNIVQCVTPAGFGGNLSVTVRVDDILSLPNNEGVIAYSNPVFYNTIPKFLQTQGGEILRVNGSNFGVTDPGNRLEVKVKNISINATWVSNTEIFFVAPHGVGVNVSLRISVAGIFSTFHVINYAKPVIYGISPNSGNTTGGGIFVLTGVHFGVQDPKTYYCSNTTGNKICSMPSGKVLRVSVGNFESSNVTWISDSSVKFILPPGTGKVDLKIWIGNQWSESFNFQYLSPTINAVDPISGYNTLGGDILRIYGTNFGFISSNLSVPSDRNIQVVIGQYRRVCEPVTFVAPNYVYCITPPGLGQNNTVYIRISGLESPGSKSALIGYKFPIIERIFPRKGPESGETNVCIYGLNLCDEVNKSDVEIWFGSYPGNHSSITTFLHTQICLNTTYGIGNQTIRVVSSNITSELASSRSVGSRTFEFLKCPFGQYTENGLSYYTRKFDSKCARCTPGYYSDILGAGMCIPCDSWSYQGSEFASECYNCPKYSRSRYSAATHVENCSCISGYYGNVGEECKRCPEGGICPGGEISAVPLAAPGYTRSKLNSLQFVKCIPKHACLGGGENFVGQESIFEGHRQVTGHRLGSNTISGHAKYLVDKRINCSIACEVPLDDSHHEHAICTSQLIREYDSNGIQLSISMERQCSTRWINGFREGNCTVMCANGFEDDPCNLTCSSDIRDGLCDLQCDSGFESENILWNNFTESCAEGYAGDHCAECDDGYYRLMRDCAKCPDWSIGSYPRTFIFSLVFTGLCMFCILQIWLSASPVPQPTLHIGFGYFQVVACLSRLRIKWLDEQLSLFTFFSGFSFNPQWLAVKCWSTAPMMTSARLLVSFSLPLGMMLVLIVLMYCHVFAILLQGCYLRTKIKYASSKYLPKDENTGLETSESAVLEADEENLSEEAKEAKLAKKRRQAGVYGIKSDGGKNGIKMEHKTEVPILVLEDIVWRYLHSYCKILCIVHTYIVAQALQVYSCYVRADDTIVYKAEPHLECLNDEWQQWNSLATIALCSYGLGVPLFIVVLILTHMRGIFGWSMDNEYFRKKYGGVFLHYRRRFSWWEAVAMLYRALLCGIISSPPTDGGVIAAGSATIFTILIYIALLGAFSPYREGNGATGGQLDLFANVVLFCGMLTGGIGSLLVADESRPFEHYDYEIPLSPSKISDLPEYSTVQVLMMLSYLFFLSGALGILAALINDVVSACGRSQYEAIVRKSKGNAVMMTLFPRCHKGLNKALPSLPADVLEDFKADLHKLKTMYDTFNNISNSSKSRFKHDQKGDASNREVEDRGPMTIDEIANVGDMGMKAVGKQVELFQWVQKGRRREAKWCPAFIVSYDESNGRHLVHWTTPNGDIEKEHLRLEEETMKVPTMDTAAVVKESIRASDNENVDIVESRFSRSAMDMKKRGMLEKRKNDALVNRINAKLGNQSTPIEDTKRLLDEGYSPVAAKMLQMAGNNSTGTIQGTGPAQAVRDPLKDEDDKIFAKLNSMSKLAGKEQKEKSNEDAVLKQLRSRMEVNDFDDWENRGQKKKVETSSESEDDADPVLAKLKSNVSKPPKKIYRRKVSAGKDIKDILSRKENNKDTTESIDKDSVGLKGRVGHIKVSLNSKAPPKYQSSSSSDAGESDTSSDSDW